MQQIQSGQLRIGIEEKGAELKTVFNENTGLEYMWSGDPSYWAKTSPVLFPIVGTLKENKFQYKDKHYSLGRHGFARDRVFAVTQKSENTITFLLAEDEETLKVYPFPFSFSLVYKVENETLSVEYVVKNTGAETLLFSVGGHPAFKLPLVEGTAYEDYKLVFEKKETTGRWPISKEGLIKKGSKPFLNDSNELPLTKQLFQKDAIVLKHLQSGYVNLVSDITDHGLRFDFEGFPYLGLWAAPNADFLCIEPWCGIADSVDADQQLLNKEGIRSLASNETFKVKWQVTFF